MESNHENRRILKRLALIKVQPFCRDWCFDNVNVFNGDYPKRNSISSPGIRYAVIINIEEC